MVLLFRGKAKQITIYSVYYMYMVKDGGRGGGIGYDFASLRNTVRNTVRNMKYCTKYEVQLFPVRNKYSTVHGPGDLL